MIRRKILITKTKEDSEIYAAAVREAGFEPLIEPMMDIEWLDFDPSGILAGSPLVFTSSHGVRAFAAKTAERDYPLYVVGRSTAETAQSLGFRSLEVVAANGEDLAELMLQPAKQGEKALIYLRGADISYDLSGFLRKNGVNMLEIVAYKAFPRENMSIDVLRSLDNREIYAVMLFSKRNARIFGELVEQYGRTVRLKYTKVLCISDAVLQSVSVLPFQQSLVAGDPDRHGMIGLLEKISVK